MVVAAPERSLYMGLLANLYMACLYNCSKQASGYLGLVVGVVQAIGLPVEIEDSLRWGAGSEVTCRQGVADGSDSVQN